MYKSEQNNHCRDNIVRGTIKASSAYKELYARAREILQDWLVAHHKRVTVERFFVLEEVYSLAMPVDVETLHKRVCEDFGTVSLTTVYNSLDLFIEIGLVRRIELVSGGMKFYERKLGQVPRGYVICRECGKLKAITIENTIQEVSGKLPYRFVLEDITLVATGLCSSCNKKHNNSENNENK